MAKIFVFHRGGSSVIGSKRFCYAMLFVAAANFVGSPVQATLLVKEQFDYPVGGLLGRQNPVTNTAWSISKTGETGAAPQVATGNVLYPGLSGISGGKLQLTFQPTGANPAAADPGIDFTYGVVPTDSSLYYSAVINIKTGFTNSANPVMAFSGGGTSAQTRCHLMIRKSVTPGYFNVGIGFITSSVAWHSADIPYDTSLFVVVAYNANTADTMDDTASMWMNPAPGVVQPTPTASSPGGDDYTVGRVLFRQENVYNSPTTYEVDSLRVGTTWADVTSVWLPVSMSSFSAE